MVLVCVLISENVCCFTLRGVKCDSKDANEATCVMFHYSHFRSFASLRLRFIHDFVYFVSLGCFFLPSI